ncbi:MAG TPA: 50S ribosomal protein L10 [Pseudomonadales bacterium]|nr:50S ribosomal protein L10 [Desulfuromonadaceae bacterium]HUH58388.1 50S ribosomal protein L10 [Pseudomonadales bacterium]
MASKSKEQLVAELSEKLRNSKAAFLANYRGITVEQTNVLRGKLRAAGVEYRVVKNTLLSLACKGTDFECLQEHLTGPTALALALDDPVQPAKILFEFAKDSKVFELKTGALDGNILGVGDIEALSKLPSREVLLGKMLGSMSAPATNFVGVLAAVPRSLVQVLGAIQEQKNA